jgi:LPXTG-site transpeptidase (sortase) family protein
MMVASRGTRAALLAAAGVMLVATGVALVTDDDPAALRPAAPSATRFSDPAGVIPAPLLTPAPRPPSSADPAKGVPTRVAVQRLGIDVPVLPIAPVGGALTPPANPRELGWYKYGALPGSVHGSTVIAGHTVHTGGGALDELDDLQAGDMVRVRTSSGTIDYRVSDITILSKAEFARKAEQVFSSTVPGRLVLITCTDWDGHDYLSNTLVYAVPAD